MLENEKLRDQLEIAKREHLRLVEENRDHASVVRGNKSREGDGSDPNDKAGVASSDEIIDLKNRAHLLSEENQALFQQISVLRSHYDQFNKDHQARMEEANLKISQFDKLQNELRSAILQRDNFSKTSHFLDKKLSETSAKLGAAEEGRRHDQSELKKAREQLKLMHREFEFYKNLAEKLEFRQTDELTSLNQNVREMNEVDKDQKLKIDLLDQDKRELIQQNKVLMADLQKMQRDLKAILAVNEEYQVQTTQMKEREGQYSELAREYREKLEAVKFERERIALKEEQFLKQIQKVESQAKQDVRRNMERFQSQMHTQKREADKKLEEIEDRLQRQCDDADNSRRMMEKLQRENDDLKKQVDTFISKEDRTIAQYEKIMDQLKSEVKDKERHTHTVETREAYARQELHQKNNELQLKNEQMRDDIAEHKVNLKKAEMQIEMLTNKLLGGSLTGPV